MLLYYLIAILAALCWAVASLISADVTRKIGGLAFNRIRLFFVSIMLISFTFYLDTWETINHEFLFAILLSGIIGVFLGDTLLFIALQKIGPRRNNILLRERVYLLDIRRIQIFCVLSLFPRNSTSRCYRHQLKLLREATMIIDPKPLEP